MQQQQQRNSISSSKIGNKNLKMENNKANENGYLKEEREMVMLRPRRGEEELKEMMRG